MQGLLLHAIVHSAGVQDRDGGIWLLATLFGQFPFLAKLFADSAYAGSIFHTALTKVLPNLGTEIVKRSDRAKGFVPLDRRTNDRLVEPLPPTGQGLGESQSQRSRFPQTRFHPPHVTKAMQPLIKSPDGLLGILHYGWAWNLASKKDGASSEAKPTALGYVFVPWFSTGTNSARDFR